MLLRSDVAFLQVTNYHNPEDSIVYSHCSRNSKSHIVDVQKCSYYCKWLYINIVNCSTFILWGRFCWVEAPAIHLQLTSFGLCQPGVLLILSSFTQHNLWHSILRNVIPLLNHSFSSDTKSIHQTWME
jgi:hypothetical protein